MPAAKTLPYRSHLASPKNVANGQFPAKRESRNQRKQRRYGRCQKIKKDSEVINAEKKRTLKIRFSAMKPKIKIKSR